MEFCEKCESLLIPLKAGKTTYLTCRKCGKRKVAKTRDFKVTSVKNPMNEKIVVVEKKHKLEVLPTTLAQCPKCEFGQAYWWMQQTRSADEPPTRFFRCAKCGHTWREYE